MSDLEDPGHNDVRALLRTIGPAMVVIGVIFIVIGVGSFFTAFGSFEPPRYFWCAFVGMPLTAVGMAISKFAYLGAVTRFVAGEVAPVGKDVTNYMVEGTKDSIRDAAIAVGQGFAAAKTPHGLHCAKCGTDNETSANFCRECGAPLAKTKRCEKCGGLNNADARFCDHCGAAVA
jgi:ribosomal protein L40E